MLLEDNIQIKNTMYTQKGLNVMDPGAIIMRLNILVNGIK